MSKTTINIFFDGGSVTIQKKIGELMGLKDGDTITDSIKLMNILAANAVYAAKLIEIQMNNDGKEEKEVPDR